MELTLVAGPPAKLVIEGPATLSCGTRGVLPQLALRVADAGGNPCTDVGGLEVGWGLAAAIKSGRMLAAF